MMQLNILTEFDMQTLNILGQEYRINPRCVCGDEVMDLFCSDEEGEFYFCYECGRILLHDSETEEMTWYNIEETE